MFFLKTIGMLLCVAWLFNGCSSNPTSVNYSYNPNLPYAYVHDACGDSLAVNWHYNPSNPSDLTALIFDSVPVLGLRIHYTDTKIETLQTVVKVPAKISITSSGGEWELDDAQQVLDNGDVLLPVACFKWAAPTITTQPQSASVNDGDTAIFGVEAIDGAGSASTDMDYVTCTWTVNGKQINNNNSCQLSYPASYSENGAKVSVVVSNSYYKVTSQSATLTVAKVTPHFTSLDSYEVIYAGISYFNGDTLWDTVSAGGIAIVGSQVLFRANVHGTGLTYSWSYKGAAVTGSGNLLVLPGILKADSGSLVKCTASSAYGSDTASLALNVLYPAPVENDFDAGTPSGSSGYGSLIDFDDTAETFAYLPSGTTAGKVDLVLNYSSSRFSLLAPRKARKLGISSVSAMDSTQMAQIKMVLVPSSTPLSEETMRAAYAQGPLVDSVAFTTSYPSLNFYVNGAATTGYTVVTKSSSGRYIEVVPGFGSSTIYDDVYFYAGVKP